MNELVIIRGLPGSGKTTYANSNYSSYLHYDLDHLFEDRNGKYRFDEQQRAVAEQLLYMQVDFALARGENVVVTEIFPNEIFLEPYKALAIYHGSKIKILTMQTGSKLCKSVHKLPITVFNRMNRLFDYSIGEPVSNEHISTV
jgi:predicted kinase